MVAAKAPTMSFSVNQFWRGESLFFSSKQTTI